MAEEGARKEKYECSEKSVSLHQNCPARNFNQYGYDFIYRIKFLVINVLTFVNVST